MLESKPIAIVVLVLLTLPLASLQAAQEASAGRGAGKGAAIGGVIGLLFGGLGGALEGAAVGAAGGAIGGAITRSQQKKDMERAELEALRAREAALAQQQTDASATERARLEEERRRLQQERMQLEDAQMAAGADSTAGAIEEEWLALVGEDNVAAIYALVGCEHPRAYLLAEAGKLSLNPDHQLAAHWIEAVIAADARDTGRAESIYPSLVEMDPDIDSVQQASIETDKAVLEVRSERRAYEITCDR